MPLKVSWSKVVHQIFRSIAPKIWRKLAKTRQNHVHFRHAVPLSPHRFYNLGALCLPIPFESPWSKVVSPENFRRIAPKIWRKLAKNRQKCAFSPRKSVPLSPPRLFNLEASYLVPFESPWPKGCAPANVQADRAKNLAEIGEKPKNGVSPATICSCGFYSTELNRIPTERSWPLIVHLPFSGGSRKKFGGNWRKTKNQNFSIFRNSS